MLRVLQCWVGDLAAIEDEQTGGAAAESENH